MVRDRRALLLQSRVHSHRQQNTQHGLGELWIEDHLRRASDGSDDPFWRIRVSPRAGVRLEIDACTSRAASLIRSDSTCRSTKMGYTPGHDLARSTGRLPPPAVHKHEECIPRTQSVGRCGTLTSTAAPPHVGETGPSIAGVRTSVPADRWIGGVCATMEPAVLTG